MADTSAKSDEKKDAAAAAAAAAKKALNPGAKEFSFNPTAKSWAPPAFNPNPTAPSFTPGATPAATAAAPKGKETKPGLPDKQPKTGPRPVVSVLSTFRCRDLSPCP